MLSIKTIEKLSQLGIQASNVQDFANGIKLLQLICHVYYKGDNPTLSSKIKWSDDQKTGNKIVNINIILNFIKKDQNIKLPPSIRQLSAFKLIEEDQAMMTFVQYLVSQLPQQQRAANYELSPPRQQQNQFDNLYFVASLQKKNHSEDSLEVQNPADKVVRKGSFKVLKPKISSDSKLSSNNNKDQQAKSINQQRMVIDNHRQPLTQKYSLHEANRASSSLQQLHPRKTIPKALERPPLYRSHRQSQEGLREKNDSLKQSRKQAGNITASQTDRQSIIKNIQSINHQILEQEKSLNMINSSIHYTKPEPTKGKSSRKIFKIDIPDIGETRKRILVQWLIGIHILGVSATKVVYQLHRICKDGVIFMEVVNYYRGRGKNICFFKEPKRSAQMHSNYQKLFTVLQQMVQFRSQLLHQYQYFIPQAQPNAFWSLLSSIHACFCKQIKPKSQGVFRYQNSVAAKNTDKTSSRRKKISEQISYEDVKFNSSSVSKDTKQVKSNFSSIQIPRRETPKPVTKLKSQQTVQKEAPYGLVQHEQPVEQHFKTERGYKQMYLNKFKNVETPSKNRSFTNSSLSKSRMKSLGSVKKHQIKPIQPSVSLQMQMAVLKYLGSLSVPSEEQLFKDPYRNGILICQIIKRQWGMECFASKKPKNIDDCRNNFLSAIEAIKAKRKALQVSYEYFVQDLVKGQKTLLYGLIWSVLKQNQQGKPFNSIEIEDKPLPKNRESQQQKISWVRSIEKNCPQIAHMKIRTQQALYNMITSSDFLFHYACFITSKKAISPNYQRPFNNVQKESNLKKALSYLIQNKIIRSDYLWKCKSLLSKQATTLQDLVNDLVSHFNRLYQKEQIRTVNFVRYIKREQSQQRQKPHEKLQTTMANQTMVQQPPLIQPQPQLQINWMRKLGFKGTLQLSNGVVLCRLVAKLGMKTIEGVNQNPQSRAECLGNIRRAIKLLPKFKWDEYDIAESDYNRCIQVYAFLRDHFKHSYALKSVL